MGKFKKMLKPWGGQEKYPFSFVTVVATKVQGESKKKCISMPKHQL